MLKNLFLKCLKKHIGIEKGAGTDFNLKKEF